MKLTKAKLLLFFLEGPWFDSGQSSLQKLPLKNRNYNFKTHVIIVKNGGKTQIKHEKQKKYFFLISPPILIDDCRELKDPGSFDLV